MAKKPRKSPVKRARKPKTSSAPGEAAQAHEWLMERVKDAEPDPYGDKAWLDAEREGKLSPKQMHEGYVKPAEETAKMGRPTGYKPEFVEQARKLCKLGATDEELAGFFEVNRETIRRWAHKYEDFCGAIKTGKAELDERVERSLYHRAVGYTYDAVKIFQNGGEPVIVPYKEHVPPDTGAAIFWLKNRRPDVWRDKREIDVTGDGIASLLDEARAREAATQTRYAN